MMNDGKTTVRQMVKEATDALDDSTTYAAVIRWVQKNYPGTNPNSIYCEIVAVTVNHHTRVHYHANDNGSPRIADNPEHDYLFQPQKGKIEQYDPERHGQWEIYEQDSGGLSVRCVDEMDVVSTSPSEPEGHSFAAEFHLRDYLAKHLDDVEPGLQLYADDDGNTGVEFSTKVGFVDILAVDGNEDLVVIELKVSKGPDSVASQVLRYTNWIKMHLAGDRSVRGIIIAQRISDKIRYAIAQNPSISAKEYEISLKLRDVPGVG
ncbi:MAG: DUF91 domain-containing protein [Planctomycetes bacterium]|nr:DUF91 domain-containing protein [Planctomycetota bacterium]